MKYFYHGSKNPEIIQLKANSKLHNTGEKVVYLTDSIPYALYYIWDVQHNGYSGKHVTGWIKDGIAYYEEQFPDQLKVFYQGVSGYLYYISDNVNIKAVENRANMFYCTDDVAVAKIEQIVDVYQELLKYESEGKFIVLRYNEQSVERQNELIDLVARAIIRDNFYIDNPQKQAFIKKFFVEAWKKAALRSEY